MRTGSAAIHAAAVTAAAWIGATGRDVGQLRAGETRPRSLPDITRVITHGFPVGELAASSSPTGEAVGDHPCAGRGRTAASSGGLEPVVTGSRPVG